LLNVFSLLFALLSCSFSRIQSWNF
jgi:hypothetical protein